MKNKPEAIEGTARTEFERRALLKKVGRFAAVTAPAVTLLLAAGTKPASAAPSGGIGSSRQLKERLGAFEDALLAVGAGAVSLDMIDGVGICLAAIQALSAKIGRLEINLQAAGQ